MILAVHHRLRSRIVSVVTRLYGLSPAQMPPVVIDYPPSRTLGDLATPLAFELARRLRKAPRAIAEELAAAFSEESGVRAIAAPNGYLNFYLDRPSFLRDRLNPTSFQTGAPESKTIVEHTAINPNKAAHVGHLRNAALGDTLVRALRFRGSQVEVQNYIDNTGVQVADVVVGFQHLEKMNLDDVRKIADSTRFDYYCWDLYARVTDWYGTDRERLARRSAALHEIEQGGNETARLGTFIADRIVRCHLRTMERLDIRYDLLTWEGDILRLQFWTRAFEILKAKGAVFLQTQGTLAGCWVMRLAEEGDDGGASSEEATGAPDADEAEGDTREKVIVRSNGTVTYVGKDIAYQLWKFGLLGRDFHYRVFERGADGRPLWTTSPVPSTEGVEPPPFGRATTTYNVIDVRQSYLQKLLKQALAVLGYRAQADSSIHFSYEMVALSHQTAHALGYVDGADKDGKRAIVEVSGRKGQGVKADDLLDSLAEHARAEVTKRNPDLQAADARRIASMIAVAAVRYFMVKYTRTKVIAFDIAEALSFEGESGPYLQYAVVRANNIFNKLRDREGLTIADITGRLAATPCGELSGDGDAHDLWALVLEAARLDEVVEQVVRTLEFSVLAKYAFGLAQAFNAFYHRFPVLNEERADRRLWRAAGVAYVQKQLTLALDVMGLPVPPRM